MLKKLLQMIMNDKEVMNELDLKDLESLLKDLQSKKIEYLNFKTVKIQETKEVEGALRIIAIASTDSVDRGMDIVKPEGIKTTNIKNNKIPMLLQHDYDKIIGAWDTWRVEGNQFIVEGTFLAPVTDEGKATAALIVAQALNGISIGYIPEKVSFDGDIRILEEIELIEVSIVTVPMNQDCTITSVEEVKSAAPTEDDKPSASEESPADDSGSGDPDTSTTQDPPADEELPAKDENPEDEVVKMKQENDSLKSEVSDLKAEIEKLKAEISDYEALIEETNKEVEQLLGEGNEE